jgi:AcrR family transcriptional regulator
MSMRAGGALGIREIRRRQLIDSLSETALELFTEQGYEATTLEQICARVGISLRTFFRHFDGKASLLSSVTRTLEDRVTERVSRAPDSDSFVDAFESAFDVAFGEYLHNDPVFAQRQIEFLLMAPARLTAHWMQPSDASADPMELEIARRLSLAPTDPRIRLFRGFVSMLMLEAVSRWSTDSARLSLTDIAEENLRLARVLEREITGRPA